MSGVLVLTNLQEKTTRCLKNSLSYVSDLRWTVRRETFLRLQCVWSFEATVIAVGAFCYAVNTDEVAKCGICVSLVTRRT